MQNSYNCRNIVTDKYSNNNQAAKSASVLSNSMKMANKPLFLVAAAMLMLIFFIGTVHAASPVTLSISPGSVAVDSGNPAVVQYTLTTNNVPPYTTGNDYFTYQLLIMSSSSPTTACLIEQTVSTDTSAIIDIATSGSPNYGSETCTNPYSGGSTLTMTPGTYTITGSVNYDLV